MWIKSKNFAFDITCLAYYRYNPTDKIIFFHFKDGKYSVVGIETTAEAQSIMQKIDSHIEEISEIFDI
jgi:TATA-box binding protein (TBP) (component of TFIID and TFIIIB)